MLKCSGRWWPFGEVILSNTPVSRPARSTAQPEHGDPNAFICKHAYTSWVSSGHTKFRVDFSIGVWCRTPQLSGPSNLRRELFLRKPERLARRRCARLKEQPLCRHPFVGFSYVARHYRFMPQINKTDQYNMFYVYSSFISGIATHFSIANPGPTVGPLLFSPNLRRRSSSATTSLARRVDTRPGRACWNRTSSILFLQLVLVAPFPSPTSGRTAIFKHT